MRSWALRFWRGVGAQLRHPTGRAGSLVGALMAQINDRPNREAIAALGVIDGEKVLELGFGPGWGVKALAGLTPNGWVCGVDQSAGMKAMATRRNRAAIASGRVTLVQGPFAPLRWPDDSFDAILLVNVIYFFDADGEVASEVRRVLRPGGRIAVYATDEATMKNWPFADAHTHRLFDAEGLRSALTKGGFPTNAVDIRRVRLRLGVLGLVAVAIV